MFTAIWVRSSVNKGVFLLISTDVMFAARKLRYSILLLLNVGNAVGRDDGWIEGWAKALDDGIEEGVIVG